MPCGEAGGENAVHFFREGLRHVSGAQAGFDVGYGDFTIEGGQGGGEGCGGIALNDDEVRALDFEHRVEGGEDARGESGEGLARAHQVEIEIGLDGEGFEGVVEHLAVLRGNTNLYRERIWAQAQLADEGTELDGFRAGAEDNQDSLQLPIISRL